MKQNSQYGLNIEWYENGLEKLDGIFVDGKKEGIFYSWGETGNGQRQDCIYEKDVLKGCQ